MILEVTYEGNGVFKVWPPPTSLEASEIMEYIRAQDPQNKDARECLPLIGEVEEEKDELREEAGNHEARAEELADRILEVKRDLEELQHEDDMETLKAELSKHTANLEAIL